MRLGCGPDRRRHPGTAWCDKLFSREAQGERTHPPGKCRIGSQLFGGTESGCRLYLLGRRFWNPPPRRGRRSDPSSRRTAALLWNVQTTVLESPTYRTVLSQSRHTHDVVPASDHIGADKLKHHNTTSHRRGAEYFAGIGVRKVKHQQFEYFEARSVDGLKNLHPDGQMQTQRALPAVRTMPTSATASRDKRAKHRAWRGSRATRVASSSYSINVSCRPKLRF